MGRISVGGGNSIVREVWKFTALWRETWLWQELSESGTILKFILFGWLLLKDFILMQTCKYCLKIKILNCLNSRSESNDSHKCTPWKDQGQNPRQWFYSLKGNRKFFLIQRHWLRLHHIEQLPVISCGSTYYY